MKAEDVKIGIKYKIKQPEDCEEIKLDGDSGTGKGFYGTEEDAGDIVIPDSKCLVQIGAFECDNLSRKNMFRSTLHANVLTPA